MFQRGFKIEMLAFIHERLKTQLSGWFARILSQGGKEILIKAIGLVMPIFAMSCFKFPKATYANITNVMANF